MISRGSFLDLSVVSGPLHVAILVTAVVSLAMLLTLRRTRAWWTVSVPVSIGIAVVLLAGVWLWLTVTKPWPDALPWAIWAWVGAVLLAMALLVAGWRRQRPWVRALAGIATTFVLLGAADAADTVYGAYPTIATALQLPPAHQVDVGRLVSSAADGSAKPPRRPTLAEWRPPAGMPAHGSLAQAAIPGQRSGFRARPGWVYVPPAYLTDDPPLLPVLVLIGGQPGNAQDWQNGGAVASKLDVWANAHRGLAPVVVMPDALGGEFDNPLCMDSALGRSDTYLAQDLVTWVTTSMKVDPDHTHWALGGFSFGGTCALQLAVAHPHLFPTFLDFSGQQSPTLGSHARTVQATFGGDEAAFARVDPLQELASAQYPATAGFVAVGAQDGTYRPQALAVTAAARRAGMTITYKEFPGGHDWSVWGPAFVDAIPWLVKRMGLPG